MTERDVASRYSDDGSGASEDSYLELVRQLRMAMIGLAEREIPDDPLPCFCVRYEAESGIHDEWCADARLALAATDGIPEFAAQANPAAAMRHEGPA